MKSVVAGLVGLVLAASPLLAHHSFEAEYDRNQTATLKGTVTKVEWQSPHVYFYVDVPDRQGVVTNWAVEIGAPAGLYRSGWRKDTLKVGERITVDGFRARNGKNHINGRTVVLANGQRVFSGQAGETGGGPER